MHKANTIPALFKQHSLSGNELDLLRIPAKRRYRHHNIIEAPRINITSSLGGPTHTGRSVSSGRILSRTTSDNRIATDTDHKSEEEEELLLINTSVVESSEIGECADIEEEELYFYRRDHSIGGGTLNMFEIPNDSIISNKKSREQRRQRKKKKKGIHRSDSESAQLINVASNAASQKRILFFDGDFKRISEIKTTEETFHAHMTYSLIWLASQHEVREYEHFRLEDAHGDFEFAHSIVPELTLLNQVEGNHELINLRIKEGSRFLWDIDEYDLGFDPCRAYWVQAEYRIFSTLAEELELEFFPFDCQDFGIHLQCPDNTTKMDLLPFPKEGAYFQVDGRFSMIAEWNFKGVICEFLYKKASGVLPFACLSVCFKASRKYETHADTLVITACMYYLGIGMFAIPANDVGDRLGYAMTLLLAQVANLQLMRTSMPAIGYLTLVDKYSFMCFAFLFAETAYSSIAGFGGMGGDADADRAFEANCWASDYTVYRCFLTLCVLAHVILFVWAISNRKEELKKLRMSTSELDAECDITDCDLPRSKCLWNSDEMLSDHSHKIVTKELTFSDDDA